MQYDQFVGQVQARAHLANSGEATAAVRATLETLGERVPEGLANNLAAQLPREIGEHLRRTILLAGSGTGERFDHNEFIARVAERSSVAVPQAAFNLRVVFEVLAEATQGHVIQHIWDALPPDLVQLATAGSRGHTPN